MESYCSKCGKSATYIRPSLFVCEDGHENWINPPVGSIAFIVNDGMVLYGVRSRDPGMGRLCLPGGIIEIGDSAEQTIIREAKEEVGLDIRILELLNTYPTNYESRPILNLVYIVTSHSNIAIPGDDLSGGQPVWRDIEKLPTAEEYAFEWYENAQKDLLNWWHQKNT